MLFKDGVHPKIATELRSIRSVAITLDTYSHVLPGLQRAMVRRFDEALGGFVDGDGSKMAARA